MLIRQVRIPAKQNHKGTDYIEVDLEWKCPKCERKRGSIDRSCWSYDGSKKLQVDGWEKCECGHVDKYDDLLLEVFSNGFNPHLLKEKEWIWGEDLKALFKIIRINNTNNDVMYYTYDPKLYSVAIDIWREDNGKYKYIKIANRIYLEEEEARKEWGLCNYKKEAV